MRVLEATVGVFLCAAVACGGTSVSEDDDSQASNSGGGSSGAEEPGDGASGGSVGGESGAGEEPGAGGSSRPSGGSGAEGGGATPVGGGPSGGGGGSGATVSGGAAGAAAGGGTEAGGSAAIGGTEAGGSAAIGGVITVGGSEAIGGAMPVGGGMPIAGRPPIGGMGPIGGGSGDPPEDCVPAYRGTGPEWCEIEFECAEGYAYTWCDTYDPDNAYCNCESSAGMQSYQLTVPDEVDACEYVAEICLSNPGDTIFPDPPVCEPRYQEAGSNYCSTEEECVQSVDLGNGVSVINSEWRYTWCEQYDDSWTCSCDYPGTSLSIELPANLSASQACNDSMDVCYSGELELSGLPSCTQSYQSAYGDWCDAQHDCTIDGTLGDADVVAHESLYTSCWMETDNAWQCDCGLGPDTLQFTMSGDDAWGICQDASATCLESLVGDG